MWRLGIQPPCMPLNTLPARRSTPLAATIQPQVEPIRVALCLPSALWNQLLLEALRLSDGLQVEVGAQAALLAARPGVARPCVLVAGVPGNRSEWERLGQWCRRRGAGEGAGEAALRVLVLGENRPALAARALRMGACGYLDWESPLEALVKAIRGVHAGELWAERRVAFTLLRAGAPGGRGQLTPREHHVLEALAEGKRNKEIAEALSISETTVKSHLNRAYHKLHLTDRLQAVLYIERHGLDPRV